MRHATSSVVLLDGLPVSGAERTWVDLSGVLKLPDLVSAGDFLLARGCRVEQLQAALATAPPRGSRLLREASAQLNGRSESPQESRLRLALVLAGLPELQVNVDIRDAHDQFVARPDLRFRDYPIITEYEGDHHRTDRVQWMRDIERTGILESLGYTVVRATARDVAFPGPLIDRLKLHLVRHGWRS